MKQFTYYDYLEYRKIELVLNRQSGIKIQKIIGLMEEPVEYKYIELYEVYRKIIKNEKEQSNMKLLLIILKHIYKGKLDEKYTKELEKELITKLEKGGEVDMIEETIKRLIQKENKELVNKGRKESLIDVAKRMLKENVDIDFITKITGLRKEQFIK